MVVAVIAILFLYTGIVKVTGQTTITPISHSATSHIDDESNLKVRNSVCDCIEYDCGCCQFIEWDVVSLNGTLCANASYLTYDVGISVTVTFNNFAIINETVSARNPPPICIGEDVLDSLKIEFCLRVFDIDIEHDKFHACFEILGKFMHIKTPSIKLGCVTTKLRKTVKYIDMDPIRYFLKLMHEKKMKDSTLPSVIMV